MRISLEGKKWVVRLDDGLADGAKLDERVGWESVVFESEPPVVQRVVFRPAGWLELATVDELLAALGEAETVRTRWETPPSP